MSLVQTIRDYVPIRMLGSGGFGVTYLVTDKAPYRNNRQCVLKQFKPAQILDNATLKDMQRRFSVEAKALQTLGQQCDQIPKLFDEFSENGEFYLVQEYVQGETLVKKIENGSRFSEFEIRRVLSDLLPVVQQVHDNKMIHRDITPDNIMLRERDNKPILIDFGAVKEIIYTIVDSKGAPLDISIAIGKSSYMPNEQKLGMPKYGSDLYSLGLTSIYLLTGKSPKDLERNPETMEFVWQHNVPHLSSQLKTVLEKAIKIDYKERFSNANQMLTALKHDAPSTVTFVKPLTEKETKRKQEEWKQICKEIERREREAKEAVRVYWEQLESDFQKDLKRRQEEDAKFKAEIRRRRSEGKVGASYEPQSYSNEQQKKEEPVLTYETKGSKNTFGKIFIIILSLTILIGFVTKIFKLW